MKISQQNRTNTKTKYNPETPQNNRNKLKNTQSDYSIDSPEPTTQTWCATWLPGSHIN